MKRVVLFDIDGTLIRSGGASDLSWQHAFAELHGVEVDIRKTTGRGLPDPEVGRQAFRAAMSIAAIGRMVSPSITGSIWRDINRLVPVAFPSTYARSRSGFKALR